MKKVEDLTSMNIQLPFYLCNEPTVPYALIIPAIPTRGLFPRPLDAVSCENCVKSRAVRSKNRRWRGSRGRPQAEHSEISVAGVQCRTNKTTASRGKIVAHATASVAGGSAVTLREIARRDEICGRLNKAWADGGRPEKCRIRFMGLPTDGFRDHWRRTRERAHYLASQTQIPEGLLVGFE